MTREPTSRTGTGTRRWRDEDERGGLDAVHRAMNGEATTSAPGPYSGGGLTPRRSMSPRTLAVSVLGSLVIGAAAAGVTAVATPTFESTSALLIDQPRAVAASGDEGVLDKLSRLRMKYAGLVGTTTFSDPVSKELGLAPDAVSSALFARVDPNSLLLYVGARTHESGTARLVAQAGAQEVVSYVQREQARMGIPAHDRVVFSVVSPASVDTKIAPDSSRVLLAGLVAFLIALAASLGLAYAVRTAR